MEVPFQEFHFLSEVRGSIRHVQPLLHLAEELNKTARETQNRREKRCEYSLIKKLKRDKISKRSEKYPTLILLPSANESTKHSSLRPFQSYQRSEQHFCGKRRIKHMPASVDCHP